MVIKNGSEVIFHYELRDENGNVIDTTFCEEPVHYTHGEGEIIEGLETFLMGKSAGFTGEVTIQPEQGYGNIDAELVVYATPENFEEDVVLEIGETVETEDPEGNPILFRIIDITENEVHLDGNHPLADKVLSYKIEVLEVA